MITIVLWVLALVALVLVVTHPEGFSKDATTVGNESNTLLGTLTARGYGS